MNPQQATLVVRISSLVCALLILLSGIAVGQVPSGSGDESALALRKKVGPSVISLVREGRLEDAFKALETVGDQPPSSMDFDVESLSGACGGLHRALMQLSSEDQFDLLNKWSIPTSSPPRIRLLSALVPTTAPPSEFARALGERPRIQSFPVSTIGDVSGIFNTGWSLVQSARESGKLKRLMTTLIPMVEKKIPNADLLIALAMIADGREDVTALVGSLSSRIDQIKRYRPANEADLTTIDFTNVVLAATALQHPTLRPLGEEMFEALVASTNEKSDPRVRSFLRRAHASAILLKNESRAEASGVPRLQTRIKYWIPVSSNRFESRSPPMTDAVWLAQEEHLLHLSGSGFDGLLLRYPLQGDFQFQVEAQFGGRTNTSSGLIYGGLYFHPNARLHELSVLDAGGMLLEKRYCPFSPLSPSPTFHRLSFASTAASKSLAVNLHPVWTDQSGIQVSPWLGLASVDDSRPLFRNLKLIGQPVIPRSVPLIDPYLLRGWHSQVLGEPPGNGASTQMDWKLKDGVLHAKRRESKTTSIGPEQVLAYQRPLLQNEVIQYEFFYQPGVSEVSPTLGRVAFLLQPEGIRIHWVTEGDRDWTGLTADNVVTEPLNRRGPRPLPLKTNDWNRVTLSRTKATVAISLNDADVYTRPIDWNGDHQFGFYCPPTAASAQVRHAILTGDWPESLPQEFIDNPTARADEPATMAQYHALNRIFQEDSLADNTVAIRRKTLKMSVKDRFEFLSKWILPSSDHLGFRVAGNFTQSQPAPIAFEPGIDHPEPGGEIVSPVYDWIDAAKELGRLPDSFVHVENALTPDTDYQRRAKQSLLILLNLEQGDHQAALSKFDALYNLLKTQTSLANNEWPEMLVIDRVSRHLAHGESTAKFLADTRALTMQQWHQTRNPLWQSQLLSGLNRAPDAKQPELETDEDPSFGLKDWIPVTAATSATRGPGHPAARWQRTPHQIQKVSPHQEDFLVYRLPLSGNFELECDLLDMTQIMTAGSYVGPHSSLVSLDRGTFRGISPALPVAPQFSHLGQWIRCRTVIHDGIRTISINGRPVISEPLPKIPDPWIAIRASGRSQGGVRDFRITGQPRVLDTVPLSNSRELTGWISYHDEVVPHEKWGWTHVEDPESSGWIVGHANQVLDGMSVEGLLRYQRPLVEDGSIEYEFFYAPDQFETHPALDRLAFILHPSGIREHWIGDGLYDRTEVDPHNLTEAPLCRRGPAVLPLKSGDWNLLKLLFRETTVSVELNGQPVYERNLEPTNLRTFGLFHFLGRTGVRIRNAVMRGDWSKELPSVANQELANDEVEKLDAELAGLKSIFSHNFQKDGLPDQYFSAPATSDTVKIVQTPKGVQMTQHASGPHAGFHVHPRFSLSGDFDIEAGFTDLNVACTGDSGIMLNAGVVEDVAHDYRALRMKTPAGNQELQSSLGIRRSNGGQAFVGSSISFESTSGRIRLTRRGDRIFYLFAEADSNQFFIYGSESGFRAETLTGGIFLHSFCNGVGLSQVTWTKLILRAERIKWHSQTPQAPQEFLSVMQPDGGELKTIVTPLASGFVNTGSPEWSADGRRIVFDMSNGTKDTSSVFVVNADGTELKNLGPGCMPSFSHDGNTIVCFQPGKGIVTMRSDGSNRQVIASAGTCAQWSPDGTQIAYGEAGNITILDVKTRQSTPLLKGDAATRYRSIINLGWAHDGRSLAFKADRRDLVREELSLAELDRADSVQILHPNAYAISPDFTFSPDNQQVLVSIKKLSRPEINLYTFSRKQPGPPQLFPASLPDHQVTGCAWSRDGKSIVIASRFSPQYIEWTTGPIVNGKPQNGGTGK